MKKLIVLFAVYLFFMSSLVAQEIKVMSYNIRLDVKLDGENQWDKRKEKLTSLLNYYDADFVGLQEVQHHQLQFIKSNVSSYNYIGVGRDDGKEAGEYSCILYKKQKFQLIQQSTFWLSQTPDSVSFGWNAACRRVCTYGLFKIKSSGKLIWVFNTHFDHLGDTARLESAKLITAKINQLNREKNYPVVLSGDFNSKPNEAPAMFIADKLNNARAVSELAAYGPIDTWNGFEFNKKPDGCIDYIFISRNKHIKVQKFATITDSYDMKYPSDHFPIITSLLLN